MNMAKFKVGDAVRVKRTDWKGMVGLVVENDRPETIWPNKIAIEDGQEGIFGDDELECIPIPQNGKELLPVEASERKKIPIATGVLDYFPAALAEIAKISYRGNEQHNPGEPLHWARNKSTDQDDTIIRHFLERGKLDSDGMRHSAKLAWRVLALLQLELEAEGAPLARGAK
jgi:hypothetical protein